jgi:hypothetical protein
VVGLGQARSATGEHAGGLPTPSNSTTVEEFGRYDAGSGICHDFPVRLVFLPRSPQTTLMPRRARTGTFVRARPAR